MEGNPSCSSPGRERAESGLELHRGSEDTAGRVRAAGFTCSSASTLLLSSFISSFTSLGGPEKGTRRSSVRQCPLPEVKGKVLGSESAAGLRPSSGAFHSPSNEPLGSVPGASFGSSTCSKH